MALTFIRMYLLLLCLTFNTLYCTASLRNLLTKVKHIIILQCQKTGGKTTLDWWTPTSDLQRCEHLWTRIHEKQNVIYPK